MNTYQYYTENNKEIISGQSASVLKSDLTPFQNNIYKIGINF